METKGEVHFDGTKKDNKEISREKYNETKRFCYNQNPIFIR